ncbi:MAG: putative toxin-antitoxin system toxin component, PIN family [Luteitalea sp.]|nr:putative toxin-antitoxin system toxin component, PIN family [Luteitalea sp.]
MRVVIDTNILVSGSINPHGAPGRVVDAVLTEAVTVLYDDRIIGEYRDVLRRLKFGFNQGDVDALALFIETTGELAAVKGLDVVLPDPDDLAFLEVADAGSADGLVTGNPKHFKPVRGRHRVNIWRPADLLSRLH